MGAVEKERGHVRLFDGRRLFEAKMVPLRVTRNTQQLGRGLDDRPVYDRDCTDTEYEFIPFQSRSYCQGNHLGVRPVLAPDAKDDVRRGAPLAYADEAVELVAFFLPQGFRLILEPRPEPLTRKGAVAAVDCV